jgi:hypothetical protein
MDTLDTFIGEIIDSKSLPGMTDEVKQALIEDMRARLFDQINRALVQELPDEKIEELNVLLESDADDAATQRFLIDNGVNVEAVTTRTMARFRELYLQSAQERQGA